MRSEVRSGGLRLGRHRAAATRKIGHQVTDTADRNRIGPRALTLRRPGMADFLGQFGAANMLKRGSYRCRCKVTGAQRNTQGIGILVLELLRDIVGCDATHVQA